MEMFRELFESMDQWRPKVLVNTIEELEADVLVEMKRHLDVVTVGPMVRSSTDARIHLFELDVGVDKKRYMEWLRAHPDRDGVEDDGDDESSRHGSPDLENTQQSQQGMVVDWCDQLEVLSHPAVGCFFSHCGWNSTVEAVASGVPIVGVPNSYDQPTNAYLVEEEWEVGVRGGRNSDGVVTGTELARCIELVMGDGAKAVAIRERMKELKEIAQAAVSTGRSVERNLCDFVKTFQALES
ncbi:unnamed protein product [Miscanthus lutarioriparius]|uniref:Uncharacterized protein n=1 Tax=Miscanthus lutarioriparius TaxID=422564 RepID=A0A811Q9U1_9POAL|nr:unnamed protein product [Miscanthus lutarioriparius]